ncbi:MAG: phosphatase PAP2 family protein [Pseudomonadota bacterium]|nr:phosphatase PAP2 family protein [Pseudomonadota bacterium]
MPPYTVSVSYDSTPGNAAHGTTAQGIIPGWWIALAILGSFTTFAVLMQSADLHIDPVAPASLIFAACFAVAGGVRWVLRHPRSGAERTTRDVAEYYSLFTIIALIGATSCYPLAAMTHGFADAGLQRADTAMGFDWLAWYRTVAAHPVLQWLGTAAYQSIFVTPAAILAYFAWSDDRARARRFLASFWLAAVAALTLYVFVPAVGPLAYLWHGPLPYVPESGLYQQQLIPLLRAHGLHVVDLGHLRGLVCAPSFHTASAVLFVAAAWPIKRLRWPVVVINTLMLMATPVEGTHYLSDMILGAAIAFASLKAVDQICRRLARPRGAVAALV